MKYFPFLFILIVSCSPKEQKSSQDAGIYEVYDSQFWTIVNKEEAFDTLSSNHSWTEGPLWLPEQKWLLFSDVPRNIVYRWSKTNGIDEYLNPSGYTGPDTYSSEQGSNGLALYNNALVLCQHGHRQVAIMNGSLESPRSDFLSLVSSYNSAKFNSPNDLTIDNNGTVYFTDPPYGLPGQESSDLKEISFQGVYKVSKGYVRLMDSTLTRPNGIALSPDGSRVYVANSDPEQAIWMTYEVNEAGDFSNRELFYDATELVAQEKGLPDGLKVDKAGAIYATGPGGVFIFSANGQLLGKIKTGQATSNCALDLSGGHLFMTADSYVLSLKLNSDYPGVHD